jgi:hypothetical protein
VAGPGRDCADFDKLLGDLELLSGKQQTEAQSRSLTEDLSAVEAMLARIAMQARQVAHPVEQARQDRRASSQFAVVSCSSRPASAAAGRRPQVQATARGSYSSVPVSTSQSTTATTPSTAPRVGAPSDAGPPVVVHGCGPAPVQPPLPAGPPSQLADVSCSSDGKGPAAPTRHTQVRSSAGQAGSAGANFLLTPHVTASSSMPRIRLGPPQQNGGSKRSVRGGVLGVSEPPLNNLSSLFPAPFQYARPQR